MYTHTFVGRRAFGTIELLVGAACLVIVVVVIILLLSTRRTNPIWHAQDGAIMRGIHQSMLVHARDYNGVLPRPGMVARTVDGREDPRHNSTAAVYSFMVMQNHFRPDVLVSRGERNPNVRVHEQYNWDSYDPAAGRYWDHTFQADLNRMAHVSYAHMFMLGTRLDQHWRETLDSSVPVIGNRGPAEGARLRESFTTDQSGRWFGYVIGGDNASQLLRTTRPDWLTFESNGEERPDNLFALDDTLLGVDVVLTYTRNTTATSAEMHFD